MGSGVSHVWYWPRLSPDPPEWVGMGSYRTADGLWAQYGPSFPHDKWQAGPLRKEKRTRRVHFDPFQQSSREELELESGLWGTVGPPAARNHVSKWPPDILRDFWTHWTLKYTLDWDQLWWSVTCAALHRSIHMFLICVLNCKRSHLCVYERTSWSESLCTIFICGDNC